MSLSVKFDNTDAILKGIRELTKNEVLVGVPDSTADRPPQGNDREEASNALIAFVMENGSPARNIPARPFLVPGVHDAEPKIVAQMKRGGEAALSGNLGEIDRAQQATGLLAQSAVKQRVTSNTPPPLSPKTLAARRRRGVTRENTLVDTGALLNSITYVVKPKG